jgi:hypothetical protein
LDGGENTKTTPLSQVRWGPLTTLILLGGAIAIVNATSNIMEAARDHRALDPRAPFLWELSSWFVLLLLAPLVGRATRRLPPKTGRLPFFLLAHAALTLPFSAAHVAGMVAIRKIGHWLMGQPYDFSHGQLPLVFLYEWRKDVIGYALIALLYYLFDRRGNAAVAAPPSSERIELRDRNGAIFLTPADILYVEAAGNYVEFHTAARTHLVRGTLAAWEARLVGRGFARIHRSRLINRAHIAAIKPTASGDVEITLDGGKTVAGSRRFRSALEAVTAR